VKLRFIASRRALLRSALLGIATVMLRRGDATAAAGAGSKALYIQPLGAELPEADVALVVLALREFFGLDVKLLPRVPLPDFAYYAQRKRYRADRLLDFLAPLLPADGERILGLTAVDISTTKGKVYDWGILGLGSLDGAAGVLSSYRCHKKSRGPEHARQRLGKVAVHETGHTLGLEHCSTDGCLMHDGEGTVLTSDTEYDLCKLCRNLLAQSGRVLPSAPKIPWPRP
jgi:archaemetzincin